MKYVIYYTPGKFWKTGVSVYEQPLYKHALYMQELFDKKILIIGGPFADNTGGMAIIEVNSKEDAESVLKNDPALIENIFNAEMHPFTPPFIAKNDKEVRWNHLSPE